LIIGDPAPKDNEKTYELPVAGEEAIKIRDELSKIDGVTIKLLIGKEANRIKVIEELRKDYDFIHYSGHAYFNEHDPDESGLVLNHGNLKAFTIKEVFSSNPPFLAFINGCESSKEDDWREFKYINEVSGLASAFLLNGVNYIGSLWEISESISATIALSFYYGVLNGESIGESLRKAKQYAFSLYKTKYLDWAAFVLYGDPTLTLEKK